MTNVPNSSAVLDQLADATQPIKLAVKFTEDFEYHEFPTGSYFELRFQKTGSTTELSSVMHAKNGEPSSSITKSSNIDSKIDTNNHQLITASYPYGPGHWLNFTIMPNNGYHFFAFTVTHDSPPYSHGGSGGGGIEK